MPAIFSLAVGDLIVSCVPEGLPLHYDVLKKSARLADEFELNAPGLSATWITRAADDAILLLIASTTDGASFYPAAVLIQETSTFFYGVGERILAYTLDPVARLWEDSTPMGLWGWTRHHDVVIMSAELELAAFSVAGLKLWSTFVEPPWTYRIEGDEIELDVMGNIRRFPLRAGPEPDAVERGRGPYR